MNSALKYCKMIDSRYAHSKKTYRSQLFLESSKVIYCIFLVKNTESPLKMLNSPAVNYAGWSLLKSDSD